MALDTYLLSIFARNFKFTPDIDSIRTRYRVLTLIITNLLFIITCIQYEIFIRLYYDNVNNYSLLISCSILLPSSFLLLHKKNVKAGANLTLCYIHSGCMLVCFYQGASLSTLCALCIFPCYIMLLGVSKKYVLFNFALCSSQAILYVYQTWHNLLVTLSDEQRYIVYSLIVIIFLCFIHLSGVCYAQKWIENQIWKLAQINYEKSERLTKELIQVIEARDAFIFSLSNEMKNSLSSMSESLNYLHQVIQKPNHLEELKNVKLNSEVLQNMIENILDVSRLKHNTNEVSNHSTNLVEVVQKAFYVHAGTMRKKDVFTKAYIDKSLPKEICIDSSRLLQIIINLTSNAIKYTLPGGKVNLYATWCSEDENKEDLLKPINDFPNGNTIRNNRASLTVSPNTICSANTLAQRDTFEEFNDQELESRTQNFKSLKLFEAKGIVTVNNSSESFTKLRHWAIILIEELEKSNEIAHRSAPNRVSREASRTTRKGFLKVQVTDNRRDSVTHNLDSLFGACLQEQNRSRPTSTSTGLGLWVCKQLCQKMSGDIRFYSTPHQESSFVFYVPVDNTLISNIDANPNARSKGKPTALVVDDYAFNRDLHKLLLEKEDVQVTLASDGKEALETYIRYGGGYFDFIMMDVQMPIMDGFVAASKIREWERENRKPKADIYFVSGEYFNENDVMAGLRAKGDISDTHGIRCLKKPIDIEMLRNFIKKYK